jgi:hypothetical protein
VATASPDDLQDEARYSLSSQQRRWVRRMAILSAPILLLYAVIMAPAWFHDYSLSSLTDRVLSHPLPPGTDFGDYEMQGLVTPGGGYKDMCGYRVRFDLHTNMSAEETLKYYQAAKIEPVEGNRPLEINVWTLSQSSASSSHDGGRLRIIVEVQDNGHDGGGWDIRCW